MDTNEDVKTKRYKRTIFGLLACVLILILVILFETCFLCYRTFYHTASAGDEVVATTRPAAPAADQPKLWKAPDESTIPAGAAGETIKYGRELIAHTAKYLGPKGTVMQISNGMNCQNCHLEAGTKPFGNNYSAVAATYPRFRARSNSNESIYKRISDCFERSLNGKAPDTTTKEMLAMKAYMEWLGSNVNKGTKPPGSGLTKLAYLDRAAAPEKGKAVYTQKCQVCHGAGGEGVLNTDALTYVYPPLWGPHSYNDAAGLFRLSNFAGYVKDNMPFGATHDNQQLTDEECWDVAAFINSQPRPHKDQTADWHDMKQKPIDFPYGPFADAFTESEHKYGPYQPIKDARN